MIEIIEPGQQTTIQDLGRHGWSQYGVSPSGAADSGSSRLANRLVGNAESAATLEILMGGLVARFEDAVTFALAGARCPATLDGRPVDLNSATTAQAGQVLRLGTPSYRLRTYLGVRGGIDAPVTLGSRSTDLRGALGPEPLVAGQRLGLTDLAVTEPAGNVAPRTLPTGVIKLRFHPGPRIERLPADTVSRLCATSYTVSHVQNRAGTWLEGPALPTMEHDDLPPDPIVRGAIQIHDNGQPIVFFAEHPVTASYPVVGVLLAEDADEIAQTVPGREVRFVIAAEQGLDAHDEAHRSWGMLTT